MKLTVRSIAGVCLAATLVVGSTSALAKKPARTESATTQPARGQKGLQARAERIQQVLAELNLTDEQKEQIAKIQQETREKLQALRGTLKDLSPEERRAKIKEAGGNVREKIAEILTDDQKAQLKEKLKAHKQAKPAA